MTRRRKPKQRPGDWWCMPIDVARRLGIERMAKSQGRYYAEQDGVAVLSDSIIKPGDVRAVFGLTDEDVQ